MRTLLTVAGALFALALLAPATAGHCSTFTSSQPEIDTGPGLPARYYVDNDLAYDWGPSPWVYEETNGIDGLQRGGETCMVWGCYEDPRSDVCHGLIAPDRLIF